MVTPLLEDARRRKNEADHRGSFSRTSSPGGPAGSVSPSPPIIALVPYGLESPQAANVHLGHISQSLQEASETGEPKMPPQGVFGALQAWEEDCARCEVLKKTQDNHATSLETGRLGNAVDWCRQLIAFTGPGWLMSIAYVDPGNLEADLQCGAQFGYRLLWALLGSTAFGLAMQLVAARLGCATRQHLAELCCKHYAPATRIMLWLVTELAIIGSDIQEVIGCSIGLEMIFGMPLPVGVLVTAFSAFCLLFLERLGVRTLEMFFGALILVLALSMGRIFAVISPDSGAILEGFVVPSMPRSAVQQVVGMVGCVVMPHNLFLHSALVQSRVIEEGGEKEAVSFYTVESSVAIITSLLINMFVVAVFAKGFFGSPAADELGLRNAGQYLGEAFGKPLQFIWALGLVAAGQSSTMTGAYAGQWVMQGYLNLQVAPWRRAVITRSMALVPCLAVSIYFGDGTSGLDALNEYLNVLQSLVLPFALVPLISFARSKAVMGELVLSPVSAALSWVATLLLIGTNVYLFLAEFWNGDSSGAATNSFIIGGLVVYVFLILYVFYTVDL